jgi:hypothetical protein
MEPRRARSLEQSNPSLRDRRDSTASRIETGYRREGRTQTRTKITEDGQTIRAVSRRSRSVRMDFVPVEIGQSFRQLRRELGSQEEPFFSVYCSEKGDATRWMRGGTTGFRNVEIRAVIDLVIHVRPKQGGILSLCNPRLDSVQLKPRRARAS